MPDYSDMNPLTDGTYHSAITDAELAYWLVEDAKKLNGKPGMNNVQSSMRQAAMRLWPASTPWLGGVE